MSLEKKIHALLGLNPHISIAWNNKENQVVATSSLGMITVQGKGGTAEQAVDALMDLLIDRHSTLAKGARRDLERAESSLKTLEEAR